METEYPTGPGMASQAIYQIKLIGKLAGHWVDWFNGSTISIEYKPAGNPQTILTCRVRDQAELLGILNRLNSLNLPLLQVLFLHDGEKKHTKRVEDTSIMNGTSAA